MEYGVGTSKSPLYFDITFMIVALICIATVVL